MLFGECLDIIKIAVSEDYTLLDWVQQNKFDYIEGSLMSIAQASDEDFAKAKKLLADRGLKMPITNGFFPATIRITVNANYDEIKAYTDKALARAKELGVEKCVLGSDKSRQLPDGYDQDKAYDEMIDMVKNCVMPYAEKYGIIVMIEPLRKPCNFINTLADGMRVVNGVNHPNCKLIADTIHMITSGEDPTCCTEYAEFIKHVHVSDWNRALPQSGFSPELSAVLREIKKCGYRDTYSFEANRPEDRFQLQRALLLLKAKLA